jgi:hypothetical protein
MLNGEMKSWQRVGCMFSVPSGMRLAGLTTSSEVVRDVKERMVPLGSTYL